MVTQENDPLLGRLGEAAGTCGLFGSGGVTLTRAPGRLDVMGGIADYSGSRVCEMTLGVSAGAAIGRRGDGRFVCRSAQIGRTVELEAAGLAMDDPRKVAGLLGEEDHWARYPAGCLWWLLRHKGMACDGVTVLIDSDVPLGGGVSSSAAIEVAVMTGLTRMIGVKIGEVELAGACQEVENRVVGAPCGVMDQVTSCLGKAGSMLEILCQPGKNGEAAQVGGDVAVPEGARFVGVHSGVRHEVRGDPYTDTRVAAFMGQKMVSEMGVGGKGKRSGPEGAGVRDQREKDGDPTRGYLANLSPGDYREKFRGLLPVEIEGGEFLRKYGGTNDAVTRVEAGKSYFVRAAADHHVMEMDRVTRFVKLMRGRGDLEDRLRAAGKLMDESHESYSVNARLGHEHTDLLAEMFRGLGAGAGFYGAKITGGGGGGTVAVLMRDGAEGEARVAEVRREYERRTERKTMLLAGSSPGAAYSPSVTVEIGGVR